MENNMKLCKDCKHCLNTEYDPYKDGRRIIENTEFWKCGRPANQITNPINGEKRWASYSGCKSERSAAWYQFRKCGKNGRFFEPIEN